MRQEAPRRAGQSQPRQAPARLAAARSRTRQLLKVVAGFNLVYPSLDLLVAHATSVEKVLTHGNIVYETRSQSPPQPQHSTARHHHRARQRPRPLTARGHF